jgi:hypothetical protein
VPSLTRDGDPEPPLQSQSGAEVSLLCPRASANLSRPQKEIDPRVRLFDHQVGEDGGAKGEVLAVNLLSLFVQTPEFHKIFSGKTTCLKQPWGLRFGSLSWTIYSL